MTQTADLDDWVRQGIRWRIADPRACLEHAQRMRAAANATPALRAYADVFEGFGLLATGGDRARIDALHAHAAQVFAGLGDRAGAAIACGLGVDSRASRDGQWESVLRAGEDALALPDDVLPPEEAFRARSRRANALELMGRYDDALRAHYGAVAFARSLGQPVLLASALATLGGLQSSLMNLDDAAPLCAEAWALCRETSWHGVVMLAGYNSLGVLSGLGRHDEALALARDLEARESLFQARHRNNRLCLRAMARARAGLLDAAQADLDEVLRGSEGGVIERAEWVWIQARVFNRRQRACDALALVEPYIERHHGELKGSEYPVDRAQLYAEAALAYETLERHAEALACERRAAAAREQAAAQAAHARRLTLQIDHELDAAHRARDEARRESERERNAREQLAALNRELEAANASKTRFLASASHDLRQPVQALAMYVAALQRERSPQDRQGLIARIDASIQSLAQLFDALLDISQLDAGLVAVNPAPVALEPLVWRLVEETRIVAGTRGLGVRCRWSHGTERLTGLSDAALLERCLRNLLDNALKYTRRGGVVVRVRAIDPAWCRIEVRDTGVGIAQALQAQVFDEFFQVGNDERDRARGLGLGLAIVRRTANLLGHRMGLRSRLARGSCFWIDLPRVSDSEPALPAVPVSADMATALGLIVIDDDAQVRDALVNLLEHWGHRVWPGDDAESSLAQWRRHGRPPVHGAIVDLRLRAGRTGLQAIAELRSQLDATLPALVVTGDMAPERLTALAQAGQPWLPKPLMPMRLRSWLRRLPQLAG